MFILPKLDVDDFELMADWIELCVLCGKTDTISKEEVGDVFKDTGLFGTEDGDLPEDDFDLSDGMDFSSDDSLETLTDTLWRVLKRRHKRREFPYSIEKESVSRTVETWEKAPAFTMLLLADICRRYVFPRKTVALTADGVSGRLFEKIVEAATPSLFSGMSVRFGWKPDKGWPTSIEDRLGALGERLSLELEKLDGKTTPNDKDKGLDVITRMEFGNGYHACPYFLIQCAVGKNWNTKRGEPMPESWQDILQWCGPMMRVVAMPWRLEMPWDYNRSFRHFGAVILDRPRLNHGSPDRRLDDPTKDEIRKWCNRQLARIPLIR